MAQLQFGDPAAGRVYKDRPAAFGLAERDGAIALVEITKPGFAPWLDLPGGALDPGEAETAALAREFGEEAGLKIAPGALIVRADQFFINTDGEAFNNRASFWEVAVEAAAPGLKIEEDHRLVWLGVDEAVRRLRHDAHAWAAAAWLRGRAR